MATSPEYPDLAFVQPRAWGSGRDGRSVQYVVIHYTAGSERATSAEDGAAYDARRTDGTSCHYFHDQNSTVQCVLTRDRANSALYRGNRLGIQHELCGTAQTRAQWLDAASDATLWRAARQTARDCRKYGLPVRRLSVAEVRAAWYAPAAARPRGICGHVDVTYAYPEDGGDHTDPGAGFPWDVFLERVAGYVKNGDNWDGSSAGVLGGVGTMQMLVRFSDAADPQETWLCDGMLRRVVPAATVAAVGNSQTHQTGFLGNLGNGGAVYVSSGDRDVWGRDVATLGGGSGGGVPLTYEQTRDAAREGAELAEDS